MPKTIRDLEKLGYTVGIAFGSAAAEQKALEGARAEAEPGVVAGQAQIVTTETVKALDALGKLPTAPEERLDLAARIATDALEQLTTRAAGRVDFHERALAISQEMPNTWAIRQYVGGDVVVQVYVNAHDDGTGWDTDAQEQLDALADPAMFAERAFQHEHPAEMEAAARLTAAGSTITREPGTDAFVVDGKPVTLKQLRDLA